MPRGLIKRTLEGRPIGHPIHTLLVHFPIGLFVLSLVLDIATYFGGGNNALERGALYAIIGGVGMAAIAAFFGFADFSDIRRDAPARGIAEWHMALNIMVLAIYAIEIIVRFRELALTKTDVAMTAVSVVALGVLTVSGYLGGLMVYDHGVGVGRHRRRGLSPARTIRLTARKSADGFVRIPGTWRMHDRQTLRLDIDGHYIALTRQGDAFFAFADACSHSGAPLSEGSVFNGHVICPWHKCQFDLHTGRVVAGPAEKDIFVYEVRADPDHVSVRVPLPPAGDEADAVHRTREEGPVFASR